MIPPTILVGVGGQGGEIAAAVLDRLRENAAESRDPARMNDMIDRYVAIFAVDTKREPSHNKLKAGNVFELAPTNVDDTIARLRTSNEFFQKWWPSHIDRVGNFFDGAGALRAKQVGQAMSQCSVTSTRRMQLCWSCRAPRPSA